MVRTPLVLLGSLPVVLVLVPSILPVPQRAATLVKADPAVPAHVLAMVRVPAVLPVQGIQVVPRQPVQRLVRSALLLVVAEDARSIPRPRKAR
jgi:hypothetical protein